METIAIGLSPNIEHDDVTLAMRVFCMPWKWFQEDGRNQATAWFTKYLACSQVTFFSSGRSALTAVLDAFGIHEGDEVILQAFTCMVVPNAIRFTGASPVFVDVDDTANLDTEQIENAITSKTKAIIVQHTFGTCADMETVMHVAKKHKLLVIEDCAHSLGASYKGKKAGTIGDAAIFSFGRDKVVSSVFGGAVAVHPKWSKIYNKLKNKESSLRNPSLFWVIQQLLHPIVTSIVLRTYRVHIGKVILLVMQKLCILSFPVSKGELQGKKPQTYAMKYPNALAMLLINQLNKLDRYRDNRRAVSLYYEQKLKQIHMPYLDNRGQSSRLRFGIRSTNQQHILKIAKQKGVLLGNWYHNVVDPKGSDMSKSGYKMTLCPNAEMLAKSIVNLPTRITLKQADIVFRIIQSV